MRRQVFGAEAGVAGGGVWCIGATQGNKLGLAVSIVLEDRVSDTYLLWT